MALDRYGFFNLRKEDGNFEEITLSNFGYEIIDDFNKAYSTDRNYWFRTSENPLNKPGTAWYYAGFVFNIIDNDGTIYTKQIAFSAGNSAQMFMRSRNTRTGGDWTNWVQFNVTNTLTGEDATVLDINTPVTIPETEE